MYRNQNFLHLLMYILTLSFLATWEMLFLQPQNEILDNIIKLKCERLFVIRKKIVKFTDQCQYLSNCTSTPPLI